MNTLASLPSDNHNLHARLRSIAREILDLPTDAEQAPLQKAYSEVIIDTMSLPRAMVNERRARSRFLGSDLFGEPAWDILLDLYIADGEQRDISVSSACIASNVPDTTAQRCLKYLVEEGVILRTADPHDLRRVFVSLTDETKSKMDAYFQTVQPRRAPEQISVRNTWKGE
ncbi:winged helix DNA-binding protein [Sphingomonas paeninsulae]|uniref:winged helix DNA-binding protein n=1 Tax=Sphingomonas paeninsulae TaxID=2319844 RepID=UPI0013CE5226|nr:winged helix DNA-binding protein [Sphingomonas paeninsulae]